ncbi:MAG: acylase [Sphingomonadales bacterium]|nr:acylase [Sphingomonadales bacterium]MDE2567470.1 acylase [Sphingomonadales bacterium]
MKLALRRAGWALLALLMIALFALLTWEPFFAEQPGKAPPARHYSAEITRDEFGVPHIHGHTDPDVAFGIAYAHAEDDFSTLQDVLAMTRGRYGAIAGKDGASIDYVLHLLDARGTVRRHYGELPADVRALLDGYASGMNRYAHDHPGEIELARLFPVNGEDVATGFALRQPFFFGLNDTLGPLVAGKPLPREHGPAEDGKPWPDYAHGGGDQLAASDEPGRVAMLPTSEDGSNAFAVGPARSGDGVTRLVSNSHQPWRGGVAWYELEIDSDSGWHFAGATFPGSPYPFLGHNETLGWTNTVNRPDLTDVYKLVLDTDGTHYRMDGKWLPVEHRRVLLPVRFGPLVIPVWKNVYRSIHGPVVINKNGAFAVRYAGIDRIDQLDEYYRLSKATNFDQWMKALAVQAVPSTNFVYADAAGNIAYIYNAALPDRKHGPDWRHVLPGDRSDLIWKGPASWDRVPKIINPKSGFLFNSNNTPWVAAGPGSELDPSKFSPDLGIETDVTNRTRRAVKLLSATNPIGRMELERIKYDEGYERAGYVAWMLDGIARLDLRGEPQLQRAQALLAKWDLHADGRNPADALAVMVLKDAMKASYELTPPPDPRHQLEWASGHLMKYFGRLDPPLGEVQRLRQGKVDLPMDGGGDTIRAATSWTIDKDGRLNVKHGDSFVMFVSWPKGANGIPGPVRSESIQPYGAATTRPRSAHYADQAPLFVAHRLKPVHFTRADVAAHATSREVVIQ